MTDFTGGFIHVDYGQALNAADDMVQQTKAIDQTLTNLDAELQELKNMWIGGDSDAYKHKQTAWNNAVSAMEQLLQSNAMLLTKISEDYEWNERTLTDLWSSVRIGG